MQAAERAYMGKLVAGCPGGGAGAAFPGVHFAERAAQTPRPGKYWPAPASCQQFSRAGFLGCTYRKVYTGKRGCGPSAGAARGRVRGRYAQALECVPCVGKGCRWLQRHVAKHKTSTALQDHRDALLQAPTDAQGSMNPDTAHSLVCSCESDFVGYLGCYKKNRHFEKVPFHAGPFGPDLEYFSSSCIGDAIKSPYIMLSNGAQIRD